MKYLLIVAFLALSCGTSPQGVETEERSVHYELWVDGSHEYSGEALVPATGEWYGFGFAHGHYITADWSGLIGDTAAIYCTGPHAAGPLAAEIYIDGDLAYTATATDSVYVEGVVQ